MKNKKYSQNLYNNKAVKQNKAENYAKKNSKINKTTENKDE